jgi:hypothetical protein
VRVIAAPGTTAPAGSFTVPRREVVAVWPEHRMEKKSTNEQRMPEDFFVTLPPKVVYLRHFV